ncbi:hypothetical protein MNBD_ALPHA12-1062 [hydrothermal vent metagenome]|uniref:Transmembrane protein n=1 Tax=hydrothermal vent metagenome TaxID=652676 RepID=A0A3B0UA32_9ZZZZ
MNSDAEKIIDFWFVKHNRDHWFGISEQFDSELRENFFDLYKKVAAGEADHWRTTPLGRLAEIVVLDQFSRQFFRGKSAAFACDRMALVLAQHLVATGGDKSLTQEQALFAYLPYMHSESLVIHKEAVRLFEQLGNENNLLFEIEHRDVLARFGRFPKRNKALGRTSTDEELAYIAERDGSHF